MKLNGVEVKKTTRHDIFSGTVPALIEAGIIEHKDLLPHPGRRSGMTAFMPDGSAVPEGSVCPSGMPGYVSVTVRRSGACVVRKTVSLSERKSRIEAKPAVISGDELHMTYRGTEAQLQQVDIPEAWMQGLPRPGKLRGFRTFMDGDKRIRVSVGPRKEFFVEVQCVKASAPDPRVNATSEWHCSPVFQALLAARVDAYRRSLEPNQQRPARASHLRLVWSSPN